MFASKISPAPGVRPDRPRLVFAGHPASQGGAKTGDGTDAGPRDAHDVEVRPGSSRSFEGAPVGDTAGTLILDPSQSRAVAAGLKHAVTLVTGAPGTGKTSTALALAAHALATPGANPAEILVLAATRRGAGAMRTELAGLASQTVSQPLVRTAPAIAFAVLERYAAALEMPAPTLISGPEQDLLIGELLEGHVEEFGEGRGRITLPPGIPLDALATRGFRDELRDVMMRAAERGLDPVALDELGRRHDRPAWRLSARLFQEYQDVTILRQVTPDSGPRYDPAVVLDAALGALQNWEEDLPGVPRPHWSRVIVDDYQEATAAVARFLRFVVEDGAALTLFGDPDAAVQGFRGAVPHLVAAAAAPRTRGGAPGEFGAHAVHLDQVWRHGRELRAVTSRVSSLVATVGTVRHRRAESAARAESGLVPEAAVCIQGDALPEAAAHHGAATPDAADRRAAVGTDAEVMPDAGVVRDAATGADTCATMPAVATQADSGGPGDRSALGIGDLKVARTAVLDPGVRVALLESPSQEHAYIAHQLRAERLLGNVAWSSMAVIARSGAQVSAIRRALVNASVPVSVLGSPGPLRDEPAVRSLLTALDVVARGELDPESAAELALSPLGGLDAVSLRRLRRAVRAQELAAGGGRSSERLLVDLLSDPLQTAALPSNVRQGAHTLATILERGRSAIVEPNANAQTVLWAIWDASGLATRWQNMALNGGPGAPRADRDLDAVLALFKGAERFVERTHQSLVSQFVEYVRSQELPADSLAAHGGTQQAVSVLTPASAAGREWDVVVVAGVQEGVWPDLRIRDSLLGAHTLVDVDAARDVAEQSADARKQVLADEVRAFLVATSRARHRLLVTAVSDPETIPSVFVDFVVPPGGIARDTDPAHYRDPDEREGLEARVEQPGVGATDNDEEGHDVDPRMCKVPPALDLRGLIGVARHQLRHSVGQDREGQSLEHDASDRSHTLARLLARLDAAGLDAANPDSWYHVNPASSTAPVWAEDEPVRVSPSKVESVTTCALRWALESAGGRRAEAMSQSLGNLIHSIAEQMPHGSERELADRLDERWDELGLAPGWPADATRQRAQKMVARLAEHFGAGEEVLAVEATFRFTIGRAVLTGTADRLVRDASGKIRVEDLKTGKSIPTAKSTMTNPQLGAYQLALEAGAFDRVPPGTPSAGATLVYVDKGAKSPTLRTQVPLEASPDPGWARDLVTTAADVMARAEFEARINPTCDTCPVRRSCPLQPEGRHVEAGTVEEKPLA